MVREALNRKDTIHTLIYSEDYNTQGLGLDVRDSNVPITCVDEKIFRQISDVKSPQGIIGILRKKKYDMGMVFGQSPGFWVILDRIQDPGNMGTIIRTIDAAGGSGVILLKGCVDPYNPKTIRSTMGSIFRVPIIEIHDNEDFFFKLIENNVDILASAMEGDSIFNWEGRRDRGIKALIIGNESRGISEEIRGLATSIISIPIIGDAESLNASVAAGIMIYEIMRKEGNLGRKFSCIC